jgi:SAM-dependent methyltransferase
MTAARRTATAHTADFVTRFVPAGARILEIGGGEGDVAARLAQLGRRVMTIDSSPEAVAAAQAKGVEARCAEWPIIDPPACDAVLFTRSLHHIMDLPGAIAAAAAALPSGGLLLIEDFDFPGADAKTVRWLASFAREAAQQSPVARDGLLARLIAADDPVAAWRADHDHDLHSIATIAAAVAARFTIVAREDAPYLYRYWISAGAYGDAVAGAFDAERRAIREGLILAIGKRIVART